LTNVTAVHGCFSVRSSENVDTRDIGALGYITMELMQGYVKKDGAIGVDDPGCWSSDAVGFLSETTSATSVKELIKVSLLHFWC
jgi:hypothetical protein